MVDKNLTILALILILFAGCKEYNPEIQEGFIISNKSDIYFKTIGKGEPLLIIHGGPVLDHSYFLPHLESLAKDYQLIFYD